MNSKREPFWLRLETQSTEQRANTMASMPDADWEALCDGCGRCCLQKLEDADSGDIYFTRIACRLLDLQTCRCSDYNNRFSRVPDCTNVRPLDETKTGWLPQSCAYRCAAEGRRLEPWHPLVSGSAETVHQAGVSVRDIAVSETGVNESDYPHYVIFLDPYESESLEPEPCE